METYVQAHEDPNNITWQEFRNSFRAHHVPQGTIKLKRQEFQQLKQGAMSVSEYVSRFTQLARYAPYEVDTDEKKQDCFMKGLNDGLAYALEARDFDNFQTMVDKALVLESRRFAMEKKRKLGRQVQQGGSSSRPRYSDPSVNPINRPIQHPQQ